MLRPRNLCALALFLLLSAFSVEGQAQTWTLDSNHTRASFSARHMMVTTVRGDLGNVKGTVEYHPPHVTEAAINVTIETATLSTQNDERDRHLKSADFLDVARFPVITFKSKRVERPVDGSFRVFGDLTIRDVTREIVLVVEVPPSPVPDRGSLVLGTVATTRISRKEFGMTWNRAIEAGGFLVGDEISITLDIQMRRSAG